MRISAARANHCSRWSVMKVSPFRFQYGVLDQNRWTRNFRMWLEETLYFVLHTKVTQNKSVTPCGENKVLQHAYSITVFLWSMMFCVSYLPQWGLDLREPPEIWSLLYKSTNQNWRRLCKDRRRFLFLSAHVIEKAAATVEMEYRFRQLPLNWSTDFFLLMESAVAILQVLPIY